MLINPQIPGIRILEETDCPADGVMFQNLWDSAIIGLNWNFRFADGSTSSSGSDDLNQIRISPGEVAVAVPHQIIIVDRHQQPERGLWSATEQIPADYVEFLLRAQPRSKEAPGEIQPPVTEERHQRTAEKLRDAYQRSGVPAESIPSVDELKGQLEESGRQAEEMHRVRRIPDEIRLSWMLFEDRLFYGPTRSAQCLLMLWSFSKKIRSFAGTEKAELGAGHSLAAEFDQVRRRSASGADELAHLVEQLPEADRQIIKEIKPIPGNVTAG